MVKKLVGAALCAAVVLGMGGSAFAGEVTGNGTKGGPNGDGTPGRDDQRPRLVLCLLG